jgi:hypothetical protein
MSLTLSPNTTCDIYRSGNAPPVAPDVAAVPIMLTADFEPSQEVQVTTSTITRWTHKAQVDISVDVRDGYQGRSAGGAEQPPANADTIYVPDKTGTPFDVVMVVRMGQGTPLDHLQVYLHRGVPPWPTTAL